MVVHDEPMSQHVALDSSEAPRISKPANPKRRRRRQGHHHRHGHHRRALRPSNDTHSNYRRCAARAHPRPTTPGRKTRESSLAIRRRPQTEEMSYERRPKLLLLPLLLLTSLAASAGEKNSPKCCTCTANTSAFAYSCIALL